MNIVTPEEVGFSSARLKRIDAHMQRYIDDQKVAGIVTLLACQGKVFHFERYGLRNVETNQSMKLDTIFRIYSMTKPITSVAAMILYEEGLFQLDDPVFKFLPEFKKTRVYVKTGFGGMETTESERPILIRDLMTHTAGLSYGFFEDSPVEEMYRTINRHDASDLADLVEKVAGLPLLFHPGNDWRYSVATDVLGRVIEVISGQSLKDFFQHKIFDPLGMYETGFWVPDGLVDRFAALYEAKPGGGYKLNDAPKTSKFAQPHTLYSGGGGLVSTATDYLRFAQMSLNGGELDGVRLLAPKTVELMTMNHIPNHILPLQIGPSILGGFGLGYRSLLNVAETGAPGSVGSYGWAGMANTHFWIDPTEELIGIFMTQLLPIGHYPITRQFKILAYQALMEPSGRRLQVA
ncbi:beta-lactamase family protein [Chloroflexi bacterium TSY]|nr:beta-lactamase family protein [Chloroflexi bacterium TSY]